MPCFHYCQRGRHSSICHRRAEHRKGALFHSVQLSKSSHHAHAIPGQTMATHGQDSQSTAPSDRPTVQNNSLLDTLLERRIDKRMTAYSNKFSASGIISDPTDVDIDVWTQRIFYRSTCDQSPQRPLTHALSCQSLLWTSYHPKSTQFRKHGCLA